MKLITRDTIVSGTPEAPIVTPAGTRTDDKAMALDRADLASLLASGAVVEVAKAEAKSDSQAGE